MYLTGYSLIFVATASQPYMTHLSTSERLAVKYHQEIPMFYSYTECTAEKSIGTSMRMHFKGHVPLLSLFSIVIFSLPKGVRSTKLW